ncbi:MAG: hypothetical protein HYS13_23870 [Planctomycetia bacterium]|nr:hypothetical protein [Planctomycetia bacterium]
MPSVKDLCPWLTTLLPAAILALAALAADPPAPPIAEHDLGRRRFSVVGGPEFWLQLSDAREHRRFRVFS